MHKLAAPSLALLLAVACDSKSDSKPSPDDAAAKKAAEEAEESKKIEERRKKREAEEAAKLAAEAERKQQIEALCVVPPEVKKPKKPKKLDKACEELAQAQMDFFARQYEKEPETLEKMKATAPLQKANMLKMCTSMDIAVGLKHAFDNAPPGFASSTNDLIATCIQKLGAGEPAGDAALPGKKPG